MYLKFFHALIAYVTKSFFFIDVNFKYNLPFFLNKLLSCYYTFPLLTYRCLNNNWETAVIFIARDIK